MPDPRCEMEGERGGARETRVGRLPADEQEERSTEEVSIRYRREAPEGDPERRIHERMPVPTVPEGEDVPDRTPSPPVDI